MTDGYIRGKADPGFWMQQVMAGIDFRKKYAKEGMWPVWRQYYRGEWSPNVLPVNLFFSMLRTVVPRVYFRNPSVAVSPAMPGVDIMVFSKALERIDNKMLITMGAKREFKRSIQDGYLFGTGVVKLGFGSQYSPTPLVGGTSQPISVKGERYEYRDKVYQNMPWMARLQTGKFIVPDGLCVYEDARWVAHWDKRPLEDLQKDPRFKNVKDIPASQLSRHFSGMSSSIEMTDVIEIRDKKMQQVFVMCPATAGDAMVIYQGDDEFLNRGSFNYYPIVFNEDDEVFWGVPDSVILEPYQLEINEIRTQTMKHRRLALIKILSKKGVISLEEIDKMLSEDVAAVVNVDGDLKEDIQAVQVAQIPNDLIVAARELKEDFREAVGFSRNQFGEYKAGSSDTTATEAQIVKMASEIRIDERRDIVADAMVDMIEGMHQIIFSHWSREEIVDVLGPGGVPVWLRFQGTLAGKGQYMVKVDPDSSVPETKDIREQRAIRTYELLKTNPIVDPMKLTQFLLYGMHGVGFDDMMKALPTPEAGAFPAFGTPVTTDDFGKAISSSLGQMQKQGGPRLPAPNGDGRQPKRGAVQ